MKVLKILAETEGNSCSHEVIDTPSGGLWPLVRKEAADSCRCMVANASDAEAEGFAKKVENELIMFGTFDLDRFHAAYGKSAFGTPYVTLEIDPDEDDVFMRFNLTYIVLPKELETIKAEPADRHENLKFKADISQEGNISLLVWKNGADFFRSVRTDFDGFEIELVRSDGSRVFQAYPEDGDAAARNAVAMLEGICEETGDELLLVVAKRLIAKIRREQERR